MIDDAVDRPRVVVLNGLSCDRRRVEQRRAECEALAELRLPLLAKPCRGDDEDARVRPPREQLADDETRLDGLSKSDLVGNQDSRGEAANDGERGLELERQNGERGVNRRPQ